MNRENPTADSRTADSAIDRFDHLEHPPGVEKPRGRACFLWIDAETGDELSVEVRGSESFFEELENLGFERLVEGTVLDPRRSGRSRLRARVDVGPTEGNRRAWRTRRGA